MKSITKRRPSTKLVELIKGETRVSSLVIAQRSKIKHKNVIELIKKYQIRLEKYGSLPFETEVKKRKVGATISKFYYLNYYQSALLITFLRNNPITVDFKDQLISEFKKMREYIQYEHERKRIQRIQTLHRKHDIFGYLPAGIYSRMKADKQKNILMNKTMALNLFFVYLEGITNHSRDWYRKLVHYRLRIGLMQSEVAKLLDCDQSVISRSEQLLKKIGIKFPFVSQTVRKLDMQYSEELLLLEV